MSFPIMAGINILGSLFGASSERKKQRRLLAQQRRQQDRAYNLARQETPEEISYRNRLSQRMTTGDPNIKKRQNMFSQPIKQMGEERRMFAQGKTIDQGLENSIIAHSLRSKVDQETLRSLGEVAEKIALYNDEYKKQYEDKLDNYQLQRGQMLRDLAVGREANRPIDTTSSSGEMYGGLMSNFMGSMFNQYMGSDAGKESMNNFFGGLFDVGD
mgnify:CR=1 FL=1|tara:strand:+ start:4740 stop:5381 length:642 start_codon:yes stop_codon:yes gene_type:complete